MTRAPSVSLILPNRNNGPVLDLALDPLATTTTYRDVELVVVDDASTDDSRAILRRWRDSRRFRSFELLEREHSGVAASLNAGLERAGGELVVSLDGDATIETPGWLERMVTLHELDPRVGAVSAGIVLDTGRVHAFGVDIVSPEGLHDRPSRITEPVGRRTLHGNVERVRPPDEPRPAEVDASIGCCLLVARELLDELGGWDVGFSPVWFEDLDLSLAARRLGRKVFVLPEVRVLHRMSLRNARDAGAGRPSLAATARRAVGRALPQRVKDAVVRAGGLDRPGPEQLERLHHHYAYWREKWGFDLLNPDMDEVLARYGDTEVCWAYDEARRAAGEEILRAYAVAPVISA